MRALILASGIVAAMGHGRLARLGAGFIPPTISRIPNLAPIVVRHAPEGPQRCGRPVLGRGLAFSRTSMSLNLPQRTPDFEGDFNDILDVRTPAEYAEDHIPGAINAPVLSNEERIIVGTLYKKNPFEARKLGAQIVAANTANILREHVMDKEKDWRPLVYCWRGGQRSGSVSMVLSQIGFRTHVLEGGYKTFRAAVRDGLPQMAPNYSFNVISGPTGSGKTKLLESMKLHGWPVLDLEGLARHRGSVLGGMEEAQPSQKMFETLLYQELKSMGSERTIWVEAESHTVGNLHVPPCVFEQMQKAPRFELHVPFEVRVQHTLAEYESLGQRTDDLVKLLQQLVKIRGQKKVDEWCELAREMKGPELVADLLVSHYDPAYSRSIKAHMEKYKPPIRKVAVAGLSEEQLKTDWYDKVDVAGKVEGEGWAFPAEEEKTDKEQKKAKQAREESEAPEPSA